MNIAIVIGTRPEAIKLAPVILALRETDGFDCTVICTGQHREMALQALDAFQIVPDIQLDTMEPGQSLGRLTSRLFAELDTTFEEINPDWIMVQGDTTSAMTAAVAGFYRRVKVAHVEAGLRTHDRWSPFPEEINRTFIGRVADLHFTPTISSANNLLSEGVSRDRILVTGNTVVDAVRHIRQKLHTARHLVPEIQQKIQNCRVLIVTSHRREAFGLPLENTCSALLDLIQRFDDIVIVYPVHLNPAVREPVLRILGDKKRIILLPPLGYIEMASLIEGSYLVLTDSGGLQEEVPSFQKPILILREVTERPEVVEVGAARLVGTSRQKIVANASELLTNPAAYRAMANAGNPFGDGYAARRIVAALLDESVPIAAS